MLPLIAERRAAIADICRRFGVSRLAVFGSAARGEDFDPARSDVDFLVAYEPAANAELGDYFAPRHQRRPWAAPSTSSSRAACAIRSFAPASSGRRRRSTGRDPRACLWDARESADAIASFARGRTFEPFLVLTHQLSDQRPDLASPDRLERRAMKMAVILQPPPQDRSEHGRKIGQALESVDITKRLTPSTHQRTISTKAGIAIFRNELGKKLEKSSDNGCMFSLTSAESLSHGGKR